jgi:hypothetical protein
MCCLGHKHAGNRERPQHKASTGPAPHRALPTRDPCSIVLLNKRLSACDMRSFRKERAAARGGHVHVPDRRRAVSYFPARTSVPKGPPDTSKNTRTTKGHSVRGLVDSCTSGAWSCCSPAPPFASASSGTRTSSCLRTSAAAALIVLLAAAASAPEPFSFGRSASLGTQSHTQDFASAERGVAAQSRRAVSAASSEHLLPSRLCWSEIDRRRA